MKSDFAEYPGAKPFVVEFQCNAQRQVVGRGSALGELHSMEALADMRLIHIAASIALLSGCVGSHKSKPATISPRAAEIQRKITNCKRQTFFTPDSLPAYLGIRRDVDVLSYSVRGHSVYWEMADDLVLVMTTTRPWLAIPASERPPKRNIEYRKVSVVSGGVELAAWKARDH